MFEDPRLCRPRGIAGHQRHWERAEFPWPVVEKLAKLGIVGDGSLGTLVGVQAGPAMQSIALAEPTHGSDSIALETSARRDGDCRRDFHVVRRMTDMEAIYTYEGTETIQTLIVGKDITGVGACA